MVQVGASRLHEESAIDARTDQRLPLTEHPAPLGLGFNPLYSGIEASRVFRRNLDMSDKQRQRSMNVLRPPLAPLTPITDEPPDSAPATLKKRQPTSTEQPGSPISSPTSPSGLDRLLPKNRQRSSLQRSARPSSLFGPLRSLSSKHDENEELPKSASSPSSVRSFANSSVPDLAAGLLIHHGPLPEVGPIFRRRCPYVVLTDAHVIQFKSQNRASEMFPGVPAVDGQPRASTLRHSRLSSSSSTHEFQGSSDGLQSIPLLHVVAVHKLDDGEPYFSIEIAYFNDDTNHASTMTLQIHDPQESDTWITAIRSAASKARSTTSVPFSQDLVEYVARILEQEQDYEPQHFHMFKVVQRSNKSGKRLSTDDLTKLTSKICILAIGMYKMHLVPLPKKTRSASSTSLSDMNGASYGIMSLSSVNLQTFDDSFQLWFRQPFKPSVALHLAALCVNEIAVWLRQAAEFLRPEWTEVPFTWIVPQALNDELLPVPTEDEQDNRAFDRTLTAYCAAYGIDTSTIRYKVNYACEDAPSFELLPISGAGRLRYNSIELLAILRALRYNEFFTTICLSQTGLDPLHAVCDDYGWEHTPWTTRSGEPIDLENQQKASALIQEIRALAVKSKRLRRMDFSDCMSRRASSAGKTPGCGICEALFPLCAKQYTNVDWIILNGITLLDVDIDYIYAAAIEKSAHLRAIEVSKCGLADRSFQAILQALSHQGATLECINFSSNTARLEPLNMREYLNEFSYIRIMDFSNTYRTSGPEPLFDLGTLLSWKLETLDLSRSSLNAETLQVLAEYFKHSQSRVLRHIWLEQCGLTGANVADLLEAMALSPTRDLHLYVDENHLEQGHDRLIAAVSQSLTPLYMTMGMLDYKDENNFRLLVQAWTQNTSTRYLDISKVSLPFEASSKTIAALESMLGNNRTLESLNIAGEQTHLEVTNFGSGLSKALTGLQRNKTLQLLHVEHQRLGMPGANALASILDENKTLLQLHCAGNGFTLQAFTVIVRSLAKNKTLLHLSSMDEDREAAIRKMDQEIDSAREGGVTKVKRTIGSAISSRSSESPQSPKKQYGDKELKGMKEAISASWEFEIAVMQSYLARNQSYQSKINSSLVAHRPRVRKPAPPVTSPDGSNDATPVGEPDRQLEMTNQGGDGVGIEKDGE
ncbi:MAG: hypothetical protein Q9186_005433 [Xanthomendoza sp. 1 TL-2023]